MLGSKTGRGKELATISQSAVDKDSASLIRASDRESLKQELKCWIIKQK